jgi:hypothetical protein
MTTFSSLPDNAVLSIASYGAPNDLFSLALTCQRFGLKNGGTANPERDHSLMDETARLIVEATMTERIRVCLPHRRRGGWMGRYHELWRVHIDIKNGAIVATLRLTPINQEVASRAFPYQRQRAGLSVNNQQRSSVQVALNRHSTATGITLKLCASVVNVDDDGSGMEDGVVKIARENANGSCSASVVLGRNTNTGIRPTAICRNLCDVTLTRALPSNAAAAFVRKLNPKADGEFGVYLDGERMEGPLRSAIPLQHGSILSLYGATGFAYLVSIHQCERR